MLAADNHLRGLDPETFAAKASDFLAGINGVHAFREGYGRTQLAVTVALAQQAGDELLFDVVSRERMYQASVAVHESGDTGGFRRIIGEITDPERVGELRQAQEFLD